MVKVKPNKTDADQLLAVEKYLIPDLHHQSSIPLYKQIYFFIRDAILNGMLKPNEQIPTELELSKFYQVSRITIRKAIAELVDDDLLIRKHGKGTFVSLRKIAENLADEMSFSITCAVNNVKPGSKIDVITVREASERDVRDLRIGEGEKVIYIARIRYADNEPVIYEHNYFPQKYSFLMFEDLENRSIYEILKEKYKISINKTVRSFEICQASDFESSRLNLKIGTPMILLREIAYNNQGEPVHRTKQLIVGEKFKFTIV